MSARRSRPPNPDDRSRGPLGRSYGRCPCGATAAEFCQDPTTTAALCPSCYRTVRAAFDAARKRKRRRRTTPVPTTAPGGTP